MIKSVGAYYRRFVMKVTLHLDGKRIGMNDYVQEVLGRVVVSVVGTLKGLPEDWETAELVVKR